MADDPGFKEFFTLGPGGFTASFAEAVWKSISQGKRILFSERHGSVEAALQQAAGRGELRSADDIVRFIHDFNYAKAAPGRAAALAEAREALAALPDDAAHALDPESGAEAPPAAPSILSRGLAPEDLPLPLPEPVRSLLDRALAPGPEPDPDAPPFVPPPETPAAAPPFVLPLPEPPPAEPAAPPGADAARTPHLDPAPPAAPAGPPAAALSPRELKDLERLAGGRGEGAALLKLLQEQGAVAGPELPTPPPVAEPPVPPAGPTAPPPVLPPAVPPTSPFTLPLPEPPAAAPGPATGAAGGQSPPATGPAPWDDFTGLVQAAEEAEAEEEEPGAAPAPGAGRRPARSRRPKGYGREDLSLPGPRPSLWQAQIIGLLEGVAGLGDPEELWAKEATPGELAAAGMADEGPFAAPDLPGAEADFGPRGGFPAAGAGAGGEAGGPLVALLERIASAVERLVELAEQEDEGGSQGGGWGPARAAGVGAAHGTGEDYVAASPSVGWDLFRPGAEEDASGRPARKRPKGAVKKILETLLE